MKRWNWKAFPAIVMAIFLFSFTGQRIEAFTTTPYLQWKQADNQWGDVLIASKSIREVGCLTTTIAILAVQAGLKSENDFDPGLFVREMKKVDGFSSNNNLIWEKIPEVVPGLTPVAPWTSLDGTKSQKAEQLKNWKDKGYSVAIAVRNEHHWVALRAVNGSSVTMIDPASGSETDLFTKYDSSGIQRVALLQSNGLKVGPNDHEIDWLAWIKQLVDPDLWKNIFDIFPSVWGLLINQTKA